MLFTEKMISYIMGHCILHRFNIILNIIISCSYRRNWLPWMDLVGRWQIQETLLLVYKKSVSNEHSWGRRLLSINDRWTTGAVHRLIPVQPPAYFTASGRVRLNPFVLSYEYKEVVFCNLQKVIFFFLNEL